MNKHRGGALLQSMIIIVVIAGLLAAFWSISMINSRATGQAVDALKALYAAEAGISLCIGDLNRGGPGILSGDFARGSFSIVKVEFGSDRVDNNENGVVDEGYESNFIQLDAEGKVNDVTRRVRVLLSRAGGGVYWNALFAGNRSGDTGYAMGLGGRGTQADIVHGNVYSGGSIAKSGDAVIDKYPKQDDDDFLVMSVLPSRDDSSQRPRTEYTIGSQSALDLQQMKYETHYDISVKQLLDKSGSVATNPAGGSALQILDPDNPAHIFRMNPSDRTALTSTTPQNDYFLEDPTAPVRLDPQWNGSDAYQIRLSPGTGNHVVYYVDGNLWLNNRNTYSFKFYHPEATGIKVTFVVKGNIYFGDNLFYTNINKDAVAFIAMTDPLHPTESGNIYFGDPLYGTTRRFEGYMYADNNFYDNNLGTPSSMTTTVYGNMTAGNQVLIQRDQPGGSHVRLQVDFDDKARSGKGPPGLPPTIAGSLSTWSIVSWKQLP